MINKSKRISIIFVSPRSYWEGMKKNLINSGMRSIRYYTDTHYSLSVIAKALEALEKRAWNIQTPSFVRSNFGLYGPGTIITMMMRDSCIGAVYFVGPSVFERSVHIWSLLVDSQYRKRGYAMLLLQTMITAVRGFSDYITYQTKTSSEAINLYLRLGPNILVTGHADDSNGDWNNPKIVLKTKMTKNLSLLREVRNKQDGIITVKQDDIFWKKVGTQASLQRKYQIVGCKNENSVNKFYLRII